MKNKSIFGLALLVALGFGTVGCGDSNNTQEEVIDDILGGGQINGCTGSTAEDMRGSSTVNITDISTWVVPHSACIIVTVGTEVTWDGNFTEHPLVGGVTPVTDANSPITQEDATSGMGSAAVTFDTAAAYPYFCSIHLASMQGVIYVVPE